MRENSQKGKINVGLIEERNMRIEYEKNIKKKIEVNPWKYEYKME